MEAVALMTAFAGGAGEARAVVDRPAVDPEGARLATAAAAGSADAA